MGDGIQLGDKGVTGDSRNKSNTMFLRPAKGITTAGRYLRLAAHWHTDTKEAKKGSSMSTTARGKLSSRSFLRTADFWVAWLQTICKKLSAEIENEWKWQKCSHLHRILSNIFSAITRVWKSECIKGFTAYCPKWLGRYVTWCEAICSWMLDYTYIYMFINVADKLAKKLLGETWQESIDIKQNDTLQMMLMWFLL